jgi:hypothetical protein
VEVIRQLWNQIAEHVTRGGKTVEQEDGRLLRIACFAVENLKTVNEESLEGDRGRIHK